jgi:signal peptide peptidase SppA
MASSAKKVRLKQIFFGGSSTDMLGQALQDALKSPSIGSIVLDIDSPGGTAPGVQELADQIHAARDVKFLISVANDVACSAAYWLGSQASQFACTPGGEAGSIGVFAVREDLSKAREAQGIRTSMIVSSGSPYKAEANPWEPLDPQAKAHLQGHVDSTYARFVAEVARGRSARRSTVMSDAWGKGRSLSASKAKAAGMVDTVATLRETLADLALANGRLARSGRVAASEAMKTARVLHEMAKLESIRMQMQA